MGTGWLNSSHSQCISLYQLNPLVSRKVGLRTFWKSLLWELGCQFLHLLKDPDLEFSLNLTSLTLLLRIFTARAWHSLSHREFSGRTSVQFIAHFFLQEACCSAMHQWLPGTSCCWSQAPFHPSFPSAPVSPCAIFIFHILLSKNTTASHPRTLIHIYRWCSWQINFIDFFPVPLSKWSHSARLFSKPAGTLLD